MINNFINFFDYIFLSNQDLGEVVKDQKNLTVATVLAWRLFGRTSLS